MKQKTLNSSDNAQALNKAVILTDLSQGMEDVTRFKCQEL